MRSSAAAVDPRRLAGDTFRLAVLLPGRLPGLRALRLLLNEGSSPLPCLRTAFAWTREVIRIFRTFTPGTMNGSAIVAATTRISTSISRGHTDASLVALDRNMYS